jgi:hypothetical protein
MKSQQNTVERKNSQDTEEPKKTYQDYFEENKVFLQACSVILYRIQQGRSKLSVRELEHLLKLHGQFATVLEYLGGKRGMTDEEFGISLSLVPEHHGTQTNFEAEFTRALRVSGAIFEGVETPRNDIDFLTAFINFSVIKDDRNQLPRRQALNSCPD